MGLVEPYVGEEAGFFKVVFFRKKLTRRKGHEPINEPVNEPINELLLRLIKATPGLSKPELVIRTGKSRATVTRALSALCKDGCVEYQGSKKKGGYHAVNNSGLSGVINEADFCQ